MIQDPRNVIGAPDNGRPTDTISREAEGVVSQSTDSKYVKPLLDRPIGGGGVTQVSASGVSTAAPVGNLANRITQNEEFNDGGAYTGKQVGQSVGKANPLTDEERGAQLARADKLIATRKAAEARVNSHYDEENGDGSSIVPGGNVYGPNPATGTSDTSTPTALEGTVETSNDYQSVRNQLTDNLNNPQLPDSAKQTYTAITEKAGELMDPNQFQMGATAQGVAGQQNGLSLTQGSQVGGAAQAEGQTVEAVGYEAAKQADIDKAIAGQTAAEGYTAASANVDSLKAAVQAQLETVGAVDPTLAAQYQAAQAEFATIQAAAKGQVTQLAQGFSATAVNAEAAYQDLDKVDPKTMAKALTHDVPNEATVKGQLDGLLEGLENGDIPLWAQPAVAAAESQMASRGMSSSSVGRNALFNSVINAAMPIAQADAKAKLSIFSQDISNEQQAMLVNSQFFQSLTMKNLDNKQQAAITNATNATNVNIANAQNMTQASITNANNFLQMDLANMNNEQQANVLNGQMKQQTLLSNQAATNTALQFNAANQQQADQFNANLATSIDQFNASQSNSMGQYNSSEVNKNILADADLQKQVTLANQAADNSASQFGAGASNTANLTQAQLDSQNEQFNAQLQQQVNSANQAVENAQAQFNAGEINKAELQSAVLAAETAKFNASEFNKASTTQAQLEQQANLANSAAYNSMSQFNAQQQSAMSQFNTQLGFNKEQFNVQNSTAIEQSNANWRRQMNQTNTAGINAVNQANAMNQFNLSNQALTFLWQEQRDAAKWANDNNQNEEERKTRLAIAALSNESMQDASTLNNIKALAGSVISIFDNWG